MGRMISAFAAMANGRILTATFAINFLVFFGVLNVLASGQQVRPTANEGAVILHPYVRLLQQADETPRADEAFHEHCGIPVGQELLSEDSKSRFTKNIFRGDPVADLLLRGLSAIGGKAWSDRLLNYPNYFSHEFDLQKDLSTALFIFWLCFAALAIVLLIIAIVMMPGCCSSVWRNCLGWIFCKRCCHDRTRIRPITQIKRWKRLVLWIGGITGVILLLLFTLLSLAFSTKFFWTPSGAMCQVARVGAEVQYGILHNQERSQPSWMQGIPEDASWQGLTDMVSRIQRAISTPDTSPPSTSTVGPPSSSTTAATLSSSGTTATELSGTTATELSSSGTAPSSSSSTSTSSTSTVSLSSGSTSTVSLSSSSTSTVSLSSSSTSTVSLSSSSTSTVSSSSSSTSTSTSSEALRQRGAIQLFDELSTTEAASTGLSVSPEELMKEALALATPFLGLLREFSDYISNSFWADAFDYGAIVFVIISSLILVGAAFVIVMLVLLNRHYKKNTEPKHKVYANWFTFFWGWFAITGALLLLLGISILTGLSALSSVCGTIRDIEEGHSKFEDFTLTQNLAAVEPCFSRTGDGRWWTDIVDEEDDLFDRLDSPEAGLNCLPLGHSVGTLIDGICSGLLQDLFWIALGWCLAAGVSIWFWVLSYKLFHYFKERSNGSKTESFLEPESPKELKPTASMLVALARSGEPQEMARVMKEVDPTAVRPDTYDNTTLHAAAYAGDLDLCENLVNRRAAIDSTNTFRFTPLSVAASQGHADVAGFFIRRGADPTIRDQFGESPLHAAARAGDLAVVEALCQNPAPQPVYKNDEGEMAVDTAAHAGHRLVEDFLNPLTPRQHRAGAGFGLPTTPEGAEF